MAQVPLTSYEWWSLFYQAILAGVAVVGLPVIWYQIWRGRADRSEDAKKQRAELEADHDRRKKQATVESCAELRDKWREHRVAIRSKLGHGPIDDAKLATAQADPELEGQIISLLSSLETFAAGANAEVFDADLISGICGSYLIAVWDDLERYIHEQQRIGGKSIYSEFAILVEGMHRRRAPVPLQPVKKPVP